ncbi:23S rRNA (guanosine(2251)-2'-O)-methyltransferase RlmB, partial [Micromonospora chalcea]
ANPAKDSPELLVGRNPVLESLRTQVPATALYTAQGIDVDDRVKEIVRTAADRGIAILEVSRAELDRMTGGVLHQGVGLQVPPFAYEPFDDLVAAALEQAAPLLVALDGVTDPRNLGAVIRSAAAFGAQGVFVPERRAAGITATAWRTSAGAAARVPVAQVTNLTRSLKACKDAGFVVVGLDADGQTDLYDLEAAVGPLVVVVGSEGRGLSRLVGETCDLTVSIPMVSDVESLNASVAAAVTLAEVARRRSVEV